MGLTNTTKTPPALDDFGDAMMIEFGDMHAEFSARNEVRDESWGGASAPS